MLYLLGLLLLTFQITSCIIFRNQILLRRKAGWEMQNQLLKSKEEIPVVIDIKNLKKVYHVTDGEITALDNINLKIRKGDIYGIIGLSGAGKSTLIRCINRLDKPTEGHIFINGDNILSMSDKNLRIMRKSVSMIFQQFNLLMQKTVFRNVRYPLEIAGIKGIDADKRVKELLEIVGLEDKANVYPSQLSGGQKQRVAIARALASDPQVLLCDEATSALDPMTTQSILNLLQEINRTMGITIVIITHEMAVIRQICTHVAILDDGRIVEEGSVDEVFTHTKSKAGKRLFGIITPEQETLNLKSPAVRVVFDGEQLMEPVVAELILHLNRPISILSADIRNLNGVCYGQMLVQIPDDITIRQQAISFLRNRGLSVEEVHQS